jgi:hypothetical protein
MDGKYFRGGRYVDLDLPGLEVQLAEALAPIIPRVNFVNDLKRRLSVEQDISLATKRPNPVQSVLLGVAGVISGALILVIGLRAIIALLGGKGHLQQFKEQIQQKKTQTMGSFS